MKDLISEVSYSRSMNNFHTVFLTDRGKELYNNSTIIEKTMLLDIREVEYGDYIIKFQTINRSIFNIDAPPTYEIDIRKKNVYKKKEKSNWLIRFFNF